MPETGQVVLVAAADWTEEDTGAAVAQIKRLIGLPSDSDLTPALGARQGDRR